MSRVEQLGDEHIIIVSNPKNLTVEIIKENRAEITKLIEKFGGYAVIVLDVRKVESTFEEFVRIIRFEQGGDRKDINEHSFSIIVGTNNFLRSYRDFASKMLAGGVQMPIYEDLDEAIDVARIHLQQRDIRDNPAS